MKYVRVYRTNADAHKRAESWLDGEIECCTPTASLQVVASRYAQGYMIHAWVMRGTISDGEKEEEELISMEPTFSGSPTRLALCTVAHLLAIIASSSIASIKPSILQIMFPPKDWSCLGIGR